MTIQCSVEVFSSAATASDHHDLALLILIIRQIGISAIVRIRKRRHNCTISTAAGTITALLTPACAASAILNTAVSHIIAETKCQINCLTLFKLNITCYSASLSTDTSCNFRIGDIASRPCASIRVAICAPERDEISASHRRSKRLHAVIFPCIICRLGSVIVPFLIKRNRWRSSGIVLRKNPQTGHRCGHIIREIDIGMICMIVLDRPVDRGHFIDGIQICIVKFHNSVIHTAVADKCDCSIASCSICEIVPAGLNQRGILAVRGIVKNGINGISGIDLVEISPGFTINRIDNCSIRLDYALIQFIIIFITNHEQQRFTRFDLTRQIGNGNVCHCACRTDADRLLCRRTDIQKIGIQCNINRFTDTANNRFCSIFGYRKCFRINIINTRFRHRNCVNGIVPACCIDNRCIRILCNRVGLESIFKRFCALIRQFNKCILGGNRNYST